MIFEQYIQKRDGQMSDKIGELEDRILRLEAEMQEMRQINAAYAKEKEAMFQTIRDMSYINKQMIQQISQMSSNQMLLDKILGITKAGCDNLRYELLDPRMKNEEYYFPTIRNAEETIEEIIQNGKSIARFGDGEFSQIAKVSRHEFQRQDDKLAARLEEVLHSHHPNLLIGIANNYGTLQDYTKEAADEIRAYMAGDGVRSQHMKLLEHDRIYYDAYVSRPYVMYKDNMTDAPQERFKQLKRIWRNRRVIIVEGAYTRMGVGNDLLDGALEIRRILAPVTSSFDRYDDILNASLEYAEDDILFLIAMGPSAGVLAYDLTVEGYQALDVGHLDLEYEWFRVGKGYRVTVPYKYNNELENGDVVEELHDLVYEGQILADYSDMSDIKYDS